MEICTQGIDVELLKGNLKSRILEISVWSIWAEIGHSHHHFNTTTGNKGNNFAHFSEANNAYLN